MSPSKTKLTLLLCASVIPAPALAQSQKEQNEIETPKEFEDDDRIIVRAGGLERLDMLAGITVLEDVELTRNLDGQIGEVLKSIPGVSASGFAPGASRPVLRGFQGGRVRVLIDGIGALDASNTSADHAVAINPLTAERIDVLRGPAVLLFGGSAIGGAVNVIDRRIPTERPKNGVRFDTLMAADSAYNLREMGGAFDLALSDQFLWHVDGSWRKTDDVDISGFTLTEDLRADLLDDAAEEDSEGHFDEGDELREAAEQHSTLLNSATETYSLGSGLSWITPDANIGFSVGYYDTVYGIPTAPGSEHHHEEEEHEEEEHEEEHEEANVTLSLEQIRADMRGQVHLSDEGFFHDLTFRAGYSDYTHTEFEGQEVGTIFNVNGMEMRAELIQNEHDGWRGSIGGQMLIRNFEAIGAEAFVPPNTKEQFALFVLQEVDRGGFEAEFGGRFEQTNYDAETLNLTRGFSTFSAALGLSYSMDSGVRFGVNSSRTERAPSAEELFASGPHIATGQFEVGAPDLRTESSWGLEAYANATFSGIDMRAAIFQNWFSDFIYLENTGLEQDELPLFTHLQADARHFGIEAEASFPFFSTNSGALVGDIGGAYIRANLADGTPLPRTPPLNVTGAIEWQSDRFDIRGEVEWHDSQTRIANFETATDSFTHTNLSLAWKPRGDETLVLLLQADNLFDVQGRTHASFTKDFAPLSGRNIKIRIKAGF